MKRTALGGEPIIMPVRSSSVFPLVTFAALVLLGTLAMPQGAQACTAPDPVLLPQLFVEVGATPPIGTCALDSNFDGLITEDDSTIFDLLPPPTFSEPCPADTIGISCPGDFTGPGALAAALADMPLPPPDGVKDIANDGVAMAVELENESGCQTYSATVTITNYELFGGDPSQFCVCALSALGPVEAIESVEIIDQTTGLPIPGFEFDLSPHSAGVFNSEADDGSNFVAFFSDLDTVLPAGVPVSLIFTVSVPAGTSALDIHNAYSGGGVSGFAFAAASSSSPLVVAVAESTAAGIPIVDSHLSLLPVPEPGFLVSSSAGLLFLTLVTNRRRSDDDEC